MWEDDEARAIKDCTDVHRKARWRAADRLDGAGRG